MHACCKRMFHVFLMSIASVSSGCCICLQWFSNVLFFQMFLQVFQTHVSCVSSVLFCMLQLLHMDVSKVDRVLYIKCVW
jgi:hypothetical protein